MKLNTTFNYSPNFYKNKRKFKNIKFIIFHYTGMKKEKNAINRLIDKNSNVSCHYFIKNNGEILNLVPELYTSWHAGNSSWKNHKSLNKSSKTLSKAEEKESFLLFELISSSLL